MSEMTETIAMVPMEEIFADKEFNCRGNITPVDVIELAKDISNTLINPVTVEKLLPNEIETIFKETGSRYKYRLLAGFRRHMAHKVNKATEIKSIIKEHLDPIKATLINLAENLHRTDLNILQEAKAIMRLKTLGLTMKETADYIYKSMGWVQIRYCLLDLPEDIQKEAATGIIKSHHIRQLAAMKTDEEKYAAVRKIKDAALRGEKTTNVEVRKPHSLDKRRRSPAEMQLMLDFILDNIGANIATRVLAWSIGNIPDYEVMSTINEYGTKNKPGYVPFNSYVQEAPSV